MKNATAIKIVKRYIGSLKFMEAEARAQGEIADAEHYAIDRRAFECALCALENSNNTIKK